MTLEELERQLKQDEEKLVASLQNLKNAKANYRKARITSVSNKFLAPFRRFKINMTIAKYDALMERLERKRAKEVKRSIKLQEKEERRQAKAAIRDKRKEDFYTFVDEKKEKAQNVALDIKNMGTSVVNRTSSFVFNVKKSAIEKVRVSTTVDLVVKNAIEDLKLKHITNKYDRALEKKNQETAVNLQNLTGAINFDEGVKIEFANEDIPFSNIKEEIQKASRQKSYMGKATNRVIFYFKEKYNNVVSQIDDKIFDTKVNMTYASFMVNSKVSSAKSKVTTMFNTKLDEFKDKYNAIKHERDVKKAERIQKASDKKYLKQRKEDMMAALRDKQERDISIKKAQINSMKQALEAVNSGDDTFGNPLNFSTGISK